jgi:hypothetical protein
VSNYRDSAQLAESFFCTPEWEVKHEDKVINQVVIFATDTSDMVERPTQLSLHTPPSSVRSLEVVCLHADPSRRRLRRAVLATGVRHACVRAALVKD